ncbi:hypothetical protein jhhlp_008281 [Lomentospora prolificans]|uniref:Uncharacterized protein n=1 Tax=Lomentospora prolificans TaxID=41688 RepID=A0A2N3MXL4_9PEZI|nr:hypothetical protein jhhlp_008281 [Lomentospora prolificans]
MAPFPAATEWVLANPRTSATILAGASAIVAPAAIAAPALVAVGFGSQGIIASSAAASIQAGLGSVAAGSLFATLQSAGMAGYGAAAVNGVDQIAGGATVVAAGVKGIFGDNGGSSRGEATDDTRTDTLED